MSALDIRPINSSLEMIAREQLHEELEKIHEYLEILREWIKKSTHLKSRTSDQFLITFLRGTKYSLEQTKKKIEVFYTVRTHLPEITYDRDQMNDNLRDVMKLVIESMIRTKSQLKKLMKEYTMVNDILMTEDDNTAVAGQIMICDLKNITLTHLVQLTPTFLKKAILLWREYPVRQKGIHYINIPSSFETVFNLFKSFLTEKLRSRLFIHSSMDSLHEAIPRKVLPFEYEGEAESLQELTDVWENKILSYREYFLEESQQYGVDETKRIGESNDFNSIFAFDGTFRQLEFD